MQKLFGSLFTAVSKFDVLAHASTKSRKALGWEPKVNFQQLIEMMIASDMELALKEETLREAGHEGRNLG